MLGRSWKPAQATVVAVRGSNVTGGLLPHYEYVLDVSPADGDPPFRGTLVSIYVWGVGDVVPVVCDLKRKKVSFSEAERRAQKTAQLKAGEPAWDAVREAAPGTPAASPPGGTGGLGTAGLAAESAELAARAKEFRETMAAVGRAKAAGDTAEMERLKAELTSRLAARAAAPARQAAGGFAPSGEASDPLDRLEKLADLHQRGVLTDAEFATEKSKILGDA